MTEQDAQRLCVLNNVDWYHAVSRAHGLEHGMENGVWTCRTAMPPYYSNAVTVARAGLDAQLAVMQGLLDALPQPFSVKDSHALLDLAPLGFRPLFDAEWVRLEPRDASSTVGWRRVATPAELDVWEAAWREGGSPTDRRVFLPSLLDDESVAVLAAGDHGEVVAGVVANRSPAVVGLSNFFAAGPDAESLFADAVAAVTQFAPGVPVVGYEHGESLARARRMGFRTVGPLRIWLHEPVGSTPRR